MRISIFKCWWIIFMFPGNVFSIEENAPGYRVSFRDQIEFTYENSIQSPIRKSMTGKDAFCYETWREGNIDTIFCGFADYIINEKYKDSEITPHDFVVIPLLWALHVSDVSQGGFSFTHHNAFSGDVPGVAEGYICLVKNNKDNVAYLLCLMRDIRQTAKEQNQWRPAYYVTQDGRIVYALKQINSLEVNKELPAYLKSICFGPNLWGGSGRCVALRIFGPVEKDYKFPEIDNTTKEALNRKLRLPPRVR